MKNKLLVFSFSFFTQIILAQPSIQWQKSVGGSQLDEIYSTLESNDGGYIAAGYTYSTDGDVVGNHGGIDMWVVKFSISGTIEWKKAYGGSGVEWAKSIDRTSDNGYIVAGYTDSNNGQVAGNHGDKDAWVLKLNNEGSIQWQKCLGGSSWDEAWSIHQTSDDGFIMAGRSASTDGDVTGNHGGLDYWVVKMDSVGAIQWQRSLGGTSEDNGYSVRQTTDGGYIVVGETKSDNGDVSGNHGDMDYWVVKLSAGGNLEWQKAFGGIGLDRANDITEAIGGGFVVVGQASSNNGDITHPHGGYDIWAVKISDTGELEWEKSLGGSDQDWGSAIQTTIDGGYVIGGTAWSADGDVVDNDGVVDFWIIKLSDEGNIQWQKTLGGSLGETCFAIQQSSDGGYIVGGRAWSDDGDLTEHKGKSDFWIVKLSPVTSAIEDLDALNTINHLEIFPNPAQQSIWFNTASEEPYLNIRIFDMLGRAVLSQSILNGESVNIANLPNGMYLVLATTPSGQVYSENLMKQ